MEHGCKILRQKLFCLQFTTRPWSFSHLRATSSAPSHTASEGSSSPSQMSNTQPSTSSSKFPAFWRHSCNKNPFRNGAPAGNRSSAHVEDLLDTGTLFNGFHLLLRSAGLWGREVRADRFALRVRVGRVVHAPGVAEQVEVLGLRKEEGVQLFEKQNCDVIRKCNWLISLDNIKVIS